MAKAKSTPPTEGGVELRTIPLAEIVKDKRLQHRMDEVGGSFRQSTVDDYAEAMTDYEGWGDFPPLAVVELTADVKLPNELYNRFDPDQSEKKELVYKAGTILLVGGFHRSAAAGQAGLDEATCRVWKCTWGEALMLSWRENSHHGRPRTPEETRHILDAMHFHPDFAAKYRAWSEREIAKAVGCSRATVFRYRTRLRELEEEARKPQPVAPPSAAGIALAAGTGPGGGSLSRLVYRDAWGREVPDTLAEKFRAVDRSKSKAEQIRHLGEELLKLKYGQDTAGNEIKEPGLERVPVRDIHADLCHLADTVILANLPHLVCPDCDGEGIVDEGTLTRARCETCLGEGELTRGMADSLTPAQERRAKAWASETRNDADAGGAEQSDAGDAPKKGRKAKPKAEADAEERRNAVAPWEEEGGVAA